jgi:hypothetical protein
LGNWPKNLRIFCLRFTLGFGFNHAQQLSWQLTFGTNESVVECLGLSERTRPPISKPLVEGRPRTIWEQIGNPFSVLGAPKYVGKGRDARSSQLDSTSV